MSKTPAKPTETSSLPSRSSKSDPLNAAEAIYDALSEDDLDDNPALNSIFEERDLVDRLRTLPIWIASIAFHIALMIFLATYYFKDNNQSDMDLISQPADEVGVDMEDLGSEELEIADFTMETFDEQPQVMEQPLPTEVETLQQPLVPQLTDALDFRPTEATEMISPVQSTVSSEFSGRVEGKKLLLRSGGGNSESEKAVELALEWLARHQLPNGSWSLNLKQCPNCQGKCQNSGTVDAPNAATAMALLPFLGAGYTPTKGKYQETVARGLDFLLQNGVRSPNGYDMRDSGGNMYSHGLASIVFCEASAMADAENRQRYQVITDAAREVVEFIEYAQDPSGGGWRYTPQERGDTSVVGWQLMALKSADFGGLPVDGAVMKKALNYLVYQAAYDGQTRYGYDKAEGGSPSTTAIGLLCRLFLDWKVDNAMVLAGADYLLNYGANFKSPYYIYYATQLLHHLGGTRWQTWNSAVRDPLINMQVKQGEEAGSWFPEGGDLNCTKGGRLYVTSLFCMTLEVYYRHMPLYQLQKKADETPDFPID